MKKYYFLTFITCLAVFATLYSCRKPKQSLDDQEKQFNNDANFYKGESDQADNDINNQLGSISAFTKEKPAVDFTRSSPLCGVTIDSSMLHSTPHTLIFNFDGITPCFSPSRSRAGSIKVELIAGTHWSDVGAELRMTYTNFKVVRLSDNKSVQFNGVKTLYNVNGNNWLAFIAGTGTFVYKERALNVHVLFDNADTANWNNARQTTWSYTPSTSTINFTANGDTTVGGHANTDTWGTNRFGYNFTTNFTSPWMSNSYCGFWRPVSGELVHHVNGNDYTLTLGVNQQGNPSTLDCAYGFKVTWVTGSQTNTVVLSY